MKNNNLSKYIIAFLNLSRLKFLIPGLAPFTSGILTGYLLTTSLSIDPNLIILSYTGLIFIMLATYYSNEYFDYLCDLNNTEYTKFSGGSRVLPSGIFSPRIAFLALIISIIILFLLTILYLTYYFTSRPLLLSMAIFGLFAGVFYTAPPFRWAYRGIGEVLISFCYGWLAYVSGYYLITNRIDLSATILSIPAVFSIFAVILINEFSDYKADLAVGKKNLVVRLGVDKARFIYFIAMIGTAISELYACYVVNHSLGFLISLPLLILAIILAIDICFKRVYLNKVLLEKVQGKTILVNALATYPPLLALVLTL